MHETCMLFLQVETCMFVFLITCMFHVIRTRSIKAFTYRCRHVVQRHLFTCSPIKPVNRLIYRQTKRECVTGAREVSPLKYFAVSGNASVTGPTKSPLPEPDLADHWSGGPPRIP